MSTTKSMGHLNSAILCYVKSGNLEITAEEHHTRTEDRKAKGARRRTVSVPLTLSPARGAPGEFLARLGAPAHSAAPGPVATHENKWTSIFFIRCPIANNASGNEILTLSGS